jgi:hypothetical protein
MNRKQKPAQSTVDSKDIGSMRAAGRQKPEVAAKVPEQTLKVPVNVAHPRKEKKVMGKFSVTEICHDPDKKD